MSSPRNSSVIVKTRASVHEVFQKDLASSSEDLPMDEWSSLIITGPFISPKIEYSQRGLYVLGSGEICAKYIPMSDSDVFHHVYYKYPGVRDPGIMEALLDPEPRKIYDYDGQDLYLELCKEMNVAPVRCFHRSLRKDVIDLRYYGVSSVAIRPMCLALTNNKYVKRLDLTSNYLDKDACYHLGELIKESFALTELILAGCKIGPYGLMRLVQHLSIHTLDILDLSKNDLLDHGFTYLAEQIEKRAVVKKLNLSYNDLGNKSAFLFTNAIEFNNTITHLDLSWNKMNHPKGVTKLADRLSGSKVLVELNLSWNGISSGETMKKIITSRTLKTLDLSYNRFTTEAATALKGKLQAARDLETLNLSHNQFVPSDAEIIINKMNDSRVRLKTLLMDELVVSKKFVELLSKVLELSYRQDFQVTYGFVLRNYTIQLPDLKNIVLRRLEYITANANKKCKLDIALYFLERIEQKNYLSPKDMLKDLKDAKAPITESLIEEEELTKAFPGPRGSGGRSINLIGVVDYVKRLWPDKKLLAPGVAGVKVPGKETMKENKLNKNNVKGNAKAKKK